MVYKRANSTALFLGEVYVREKRRKRGSRPVEERRVSRITRDFPVAGVGGQSDPGTTVRKHRLTVKYQQVVLSMAAIGSGRGRYISASGHSYSCASPQQHSNTAPGVLLATDE